jgi:drug/metabolite transporter (DMT)-like permease
MQYIAALISISLGAVAQYFFKTGVVAVSGKSNGIAEAVKSGIANLHIWGGLFCYGFSLLLWFYVLSKMELSRAYPLVSLGYVFTLVLGYFLLNEAITPAKIAGISLIVTGVFVLTR